MGIMLATAACFVLIKIGLAYAPPLRFGGLRLLLAGVALLPLAGSGWRLPPKLWGPTALLALASSALGYSSMFISPKLTEAGIAVVLGNSQPLVVTLLAAWLLAERLSWGKGLALVLGLAGVSLLAYPALRSAGTSLDGALLALASSLAFALGTVLIKRVNPGTSLIALSAWQLILGSLPLVVASGLFEASQVIRWAPQFIAVLLALALVGTAFVTAGWYWLVQGAEVGRLSQWFFLVPAIGLGLAVGLLGERVVWVQGAGLVLVSAGLMLLNLEERVQNPPRAKPAAKGGEW
jgi:O-acetylserine/cysteine efflux transporter